MAVQLGRTMSFATMGFLELIHAFDLRNHMLSIFQIGVFSNRQLVGAFFVGLVLQVAVIAIPPAASFFKVMTLDSVEWLYVAGMSLIILVINEIVKVFLRRNARKRGELLHS